MAWADSHPIPTPSPPPATAIGTTDMDHLDGNFCYLEKFRLYETRARFYLIGTDHGKRFFRVLKIDRSERSELNISEDPMIYSQQEVNNLLKRISEGNRSTGGLTFIGKAYGIIGCIKFMESYYLIVVRKRRQIGSICGHAIYGIEESQMITVPHSSVQSDIAHSKNELRYKKLLSSVDLTKDFFYSYTYPIMKSLQKNVTENINGCMPYENMFVWNAFLTITIRSRCNSTLWTIPLVHGNFGQVRLSIYGREFTLTLISRRSRHFAGTRYLKRGVNDCGWVANDVETEQIVLDEEAGSSKGRMSSVVQMRGSIPLFWSQDSRLSPKPDIILQRYDPTYEATMLHFEDLVKRYNNPVIVLNLIKTVEKRPREMMLRREFAHAVGYLNRILPKENQLKFIHWDFNKFAKSKANVLAVLGGVANEALDLTGFYYSGKPMMNKRSGTKFRRTATRELSLSNHMAGSEDLVRINSNAKSLNPTVTSEKEKVINQHLDRDGGSCFQSGVLRTNCIDCLDRTNVAQYVYGLAALGRQLHTMGLTDTVKVDHNSSIAATLMDMYQNMGDALAQQYGGSAAHNTIFPEKQGKWKATTQSRELLKSIKRYYSNAYTDGEKQDAINLFLGYFEPQEGKPALWELDSDYYLHVNSAGSEIPSTNGKNSLKTPRVECSTLPASQNAEFQINLAPVPACKKDFARMKLTSFDKLLETTGSYIKNVRLCSELDVKDNGIVSSPVVAPDAAEIQLKSQNWLFGQRKQEESVAAPKIGLVDNGAQCRENFTIDEYGDLSSNVPNNEDLFRSYLNSTANGDQNWYDDTLIYVQDESSEEYRHYAKLCQDIAIDPFQHDPDKEKHYETALRLGLGNADDTLVEAEMEAALRESSRIGSDLGISPSL